MIGSGCSALVSLILTLADEGQLRGMVFWLLGDLNGATHWEIVWIALAVALVVVWPTRARARLAGARRCLGGDARRAGRPASPRRAAGGGAGHRRGGRDGRRDRLRRPRRSARAAAALGVRAAPLLLPASALAGGAFVVAVDAVARTIVAPLQLPVGVLAAAVGVPTFIAMLLARPGRGR